MRLRFSLRTFLIAVSLLCVVLWIVRQNWIGVYLTAERHEKALTIYQENYMLAHDGMSGWSIKPPYYVELTREWIHPKAYARADSLHLGIGWAYLRQELHDLRNLNGLHEICGEIDSLALSEAKQFGEIPELRNVILSIPGPVESAALSHLASCPKLEQFWVRVPQTDHETIEAIARSQSLKTVLLCGNQIGASEMERVAECRTIEKLLLENVTLDVEKLKRLKRLPKLHELHFVNCELNRREVETLADLSLAGIYIFDNEHKLLASVAPLARSKTLKTLVVHTEGSEKRGELAAFANCLKLERIHWPKYHIDIDELRALAACPTLMHATFTSDLPDSEVQSFIQSKPGLTFNLIPISAPLSGNENAGP